MPERPSAPEIEHKGFRDKAAPLVKEPGLPWRRGLRIDQISELQADLLDTTCDLVLNGLS
jgi:hypothetical protein